MDAHHVFISYASADKAAADAVCVALEQAGIGCWIAPRDISAGKLYAADIVDAIHGARVFLLVFSTAANASVQVQREVDRAVSLGLPILPLRIEDVAPSAALEYYLAGQHWLDALTAPLKAHLGELTQAVRGLVAEPAATAPAPAGASRAQREERRVVTCVSFDLDDFATRSAYVDPEVVDGLLRRYADLVRKTAESYGGSIVATAGDTVSAVFGVPAVHEDDPERAVLAALRTVQGAEDLPCLGGNQVTMRAGIETGEALVRLGGVAGSEESVLTGGPLTAAGRLRALCPGGGVVIGEATHALTGDGFECEALAIGEGEGARRPAAWRVEAPRSRPGSAPVSPDLTPLIGRETELAYLNSLVEKAAGSSSPLVVLIVGEPGIGKTRLLAELRGSMGNHRAAVVWRQGRCLPYGDGVAFWALGEVFKSHAGILETDDLATVQAKIAAVVPGGPDREWLSNRLRALLGLEAPQAGRDENSAAWLRLLEELASAGPAVVVIEDLHWADDALLAFLDYFAANAADVPLLLIGTARPELFEPHPSFAAAVGRINRVVLEPLSATETWSLVTSLLEGMSMPREMGEAVVARSEGNPFYAGESVRLLRDRAVADVSRVLDGAAAATTGAFGDAAPVPGSVQAVIAARLDTLPSQHKAVLADAAVVGGVFWSGAVAALGDGGRDGVDEALPGLVAKQLIHRVRATSMEGESEFAFAHALTRDVVYAQLPLAARARKHAAVARWIERKTDERAEDLADVLAHHYATALDLARAVGETELVDSLVEPAVRCLTLAGDRAWAMDVAAAERHYARALELAGADGPARLGLLAKWGKAVIQRGRPLEAVAALEEATEGLRAAGDVRAAALAQMTLGEALFDVDEVRSFELSSGVIALLEADGPTPELLAALNVWVGNSWGQANPRATMHAAEQAIALAERLGVPPDPRAVCLRGCARCDMGDAGGLDDLRQALEMARIAGTGEHMGGISWTVGCEAYMFEGFRSGLEIVREGLGYAQRRGHVEQELSLRSAIVWISESLGEWDAVIGGALAVEPLLEAGSYAWTLALTRAYHLQVLVQRGRAPEAGDLASLVADSAHRETDHTVAVYATVAAAQRLAAGDVDAALGLLAIGDTAYRWPGGFWWAEFLPLAVRTALAAGDLDVAERLVGSIEPLQPLGEHALVAAQALVTEANGDHEEAASAFADAALRWHVFEMPYEEAQALLGQGRCLTALGRAPEAAAPLTAARAIFARLGAKPALVEADALLVQGYGAAIDGT